MTVDFASASAGGSAINDLNLGDNVRDLVLDAAGNTYLVGKFAGTVDFDLGAGTYELTSSVTDARDNYAAKYDPSGALLWAQSFGGDANDGFDREIAVDGVGNIFIVGTFTGSAQFGSTALTSLGGFDAFLTKLDADGNFVWAKQFGGANADYGNGVAVDNTGNVLVIADTFGVPGGSGARDALIGKFDPNGNSLWTSVVGASSSIAAKGKSTPTGYAGGTNISADAAGNVYATGYMYGAVDFDPGVGVTSVSGLAFVMKVSPNGAFAWARSFSRSGSPTPDPRVRPADIAVDANGTVYSTGSYYGSVDFDPGAHKSQQLVFDAGRANLAYVSALDSSGNFLWAKTTRCMVTASSVSVTPEALALDGQGGVYVTGAFDTTIDFDPASTTFGLASAGSRDAFLWHLDASGGFVWAGQMGGASTDFGRAIAADDAGNIVVAGNFSGTGDFDPGLGVSSLTSAGGYDFFITKLIQTGPSPISSSFATAKTSSDDLHALALQAYLEDEFSVASSRRLPKSFFRTATIRSSVALAG